MPPETSVILRLSTDGFKFIPINGTFEYEEPRPGEELVDMDIVALPVECGECGHPLFLVSESIIRGSVPVAVVRGECPNCRTLMEEDLLFEYTRIGDNLRLMDVTSHECNPVPLANPERAKKTLARYP